MRLTLATYQLEKGDVEANMESGNEDQKDHNSCPVSALLEPPEGQEGRSQVEGARSEYFPGESIPVGKNDFQEAKADAEEQSGCIRVALQIAFEILTNKENASQFFRKC
jgi:hypothetical protein